MKIREVKDLLVSSDVQKNEGFPPKAPRRSIPARSQPDLPGSKNAGFGPVWGHLLDLVLISSAQQGRQEELRRDAGFGPA